MYGMKYLEHDYRVASDDDHAYPDLLTAWSLLQRLVEDDVEIDLCQHQHVAGGSYFCNVHRILGELP